MDFAVLPSPLCPPRRAGGARTPPARALRASLNPACGTRSAALSTSSPAADRTPPARALRASLNPASVPRPTATSPAAACTPPARALRVSLNPACVSRPSAAAKQPKRPELSGDKDPKTKRPSPAAVDGKENKNATASKVGTVVRFCSRVDEAPRLALGNTTTRIRGAASVDHAGKSASAAPAPVTKRKATPADSEIAMLRPNTVRIRVRSAAEDHAGASAAPAPAAKREATPADSEIATLGPCSRGDRASRSPLGNTARLRVDPAAEGHAAPAPAVKRKAAPLDSGQAKRRASHAAVTVAGASPSPKSLDNGGTVRDLLETARTAADAIRRREIEQLRAASRRELERVVRTVEFNDPFISPQDVFR